MFEDTPSIYAGSPEFIRSELNSFVLPPTDVSLEFATDHVEFHPLVSIKEAFAPVEFLIQLEGNRFLNLADSYMLLKFRILQQDGSNCGTGDVVAPDCNAFHAFFSNLEIYVNSQLCYDSQNMYPHVAFIERLLANNELEKKGLMLNEFWYENGTPDTFNISDKGFQKRYDKTKESRQYLLMGTFAANLFFQSRWLPPNTQVRIVLRRSVPEFSLTAAYDKKTGVSGSPYQVRFDEAIFCASRKIVTRQVMEFHEQHKALLMYKFPTREIEIKTFTAAQGMSNASSDAIIFGKIPQLIVLGMITNSAFNGVLSKSAFNYQSFRLSELSVSWAGETVEHRVIPFSYQSEKGSGCDNFVKAIRALKRTARNQDLGNAINQDNFLSGHFLIAIELLSNLGSALSVNKRGQIKVNLRFEKPLEQTINVILWCQYQAVIEISKDKQVFFDR